jgi:hypothetical protein
MCVSTPKIESGTNRGEGDEFGYVESSGDDDDSVVLPMMACSEVSSAQDKLENSLARIESGISDFISKANIRQELSRINLVRGKATDSKDFPDGSDFAEDELTEEERSRLEKAVSNGREHAAKSKKEIFQAIEDAEDLEMMMLEDQAHSCRLLS